MRRIPVLGVVFIALRANAEAAEARRDKQSITKDNEGEGLAAGAR